MSSREGHDAMALQREQVLLLLGAVTNPGNPNENLYHQGWENPNSLLSNDQISENHSRKTSLELEDDTEDTPCKYEFLPKKSKRRKKTQDQMNEVWPGNLNANSKIENNSSQEVDEAENETVPSECSLVSTTECKSSSTECVESSLLRNNAKAASDKSQPKTSQLPEGLEDILKRAQMYTNQRLQHMNTSPAVSEVSNGVETSTGLTRPAASNGLPRPASVVHNMWEYPTVNSVTENIKQLNLKNPDLLHDYSHLFTRADEYTKGCKWSPDGELLLVLSSSQKFSIIDPQIEKLTAQGTNKCPQESPLTITEGELVYDYQWYPFMSAADPDTNCFVCCCRGLPIHLWDAGRGALVCSYQPYNHLDELAPAYSLGFSGDGSRLVCGFKKIIRVFDTARPGRKCSSMCAKKQNGIISCFSHHPYLHHVMAAGSYLGSVGLYSHDTGRAFCVLNGHKGGVTQIEFSSDGYRLYTGARMDDELLCWDVRQMGRVLQSYRRLVRSNQRIAFQLTSAGQRVLMSGSTEGRVMSWFDEEYSSTEWPCSPDHSFQAHDDCVNGISFNPHKALLATSSGQRHPLPHPDDSKSRRVQPPAPSVRLWTLAETHARRL